MGRERRDKPKQKCGGRFELAGRGFPVSDVNGCVKVSE